MLEKYRRSTPTEPTDLFANLIQLRTGGEIAAQRRGEPGESGLWTVAAFHAESNESVHSHVWERHPGGDELLCVLSGALSVHLRGDDAGPATSLRPGTFFVVPAGKWHRLTVDEPGDLLSITPRLDTEHEKVQTSGSASPTEQATAT